MHPKLRGMPILCSVGWSSFLGEVRHFTETLRWSGWLVALYRQGPHLHSSCRLIGKTLEKKKVCFFGLAWAFVNKFPVGRFRHLPFFRDMKGERKTFPMLK